MGCCNGSLDSWYIEVFSVVIPLSCFIAIIWHKLESSMCICNLINKTDQETLESVQRHTTKYIRGLSIQTLSLLA